MIEVKMTHFYIESARFGLLANIWVAEAFGHWASDAFGREHSLTQDKWPDNVALMKLLRTLKREGLVVAESTSQRLMEVIEQYDLFALWQSMNRRPATEYNLGVLWKDGKCRAKKIIIDTSEED